MSLWISFQTRKNAAVLEREERRAMSSYLKGVGSLRLRILLGLSLITLPALLLKELYRPRLAMLADGPGLGDGDGLSIVTEFYKINGLLRRSRTDGVWLYL